jgi:hypothetical protein
MLRTLIDEIPSEVREAQQVVVALCTAEELSPESGEMAWHDM